MVTIVVRKISDGVNLESTHTGNEKEGTTESNPAMIDWEGWRKLTKRDFSNILNSISLMKYSHQFCKSFGNAILDMTWHSQLVCSNTSCSRKCMNHSSSCVYTKTLPFLDIASFACADKFSDPIHFCHLICGFIVSLWTSFEKQRTTLPISCMYHHMKMLLILTRRTFNFIM